MSPIFPSFSQSFMESAAMVLENMPPSNPSNYFHIHPLFCAQEVDEMSLSNSVNGQDIVVGEMSLSNSVNGQDIVKWTRCH
jgi:hypothetical protein